MNRFLSVFVLAVIVTLFVQGVRADGIIIPESPYPEPPYPHPPMPPYPERIPYLEIQYHHVDVDIENQYARTDIDQVFHNPSRRELEGTYVFPVPESASISKFSMYVDGEELSAELLEKDKARRIYEDIVRRMRDPALLEYMGRNLFKARVYPIPARGDKRITLSYEEMLSCEGGICRYVYPLSTEKFSSKKLESVRVSVTVEAKEPIKTVYSPTHDVHVDWISARKIRVSYEDEDVLPKKDFELIYTVSQDDVGLTLLTHRQKGEDGHFALFIAPPFDADDNRIPQDVVFVLDTSGSMSGEKIEQAKDALTYCVESLDDDDRFAVIGFASEVRPWKSRMVDVDPDSRDSARDFIAGIRAAGGTNIDDALSDALALLPDDSERMQTVIFLTDGKPTVGTTDIEKILATVKRENDARARLFVFGVGYDVNTHLLDRLVEDHGGVCEYVKPDEDIEVKVSSLYRRISSPVLSDLELDFDGIDVSSVYPKRLPDLYEGGQVMVFGRFEDDGEATITLTGYVAGEKKTFEYDAYFPTVDRDNSFLPRLWATRRIGYLLSEIRLTGEDRELKEEIIGLSLEYGIMTPYTSFLVQEDEDYTVPVRRGGPTPMPLMERAREQFDAVLSASNFAADSGAGAVKAAVHTEGLRQSQTVTDDESGRVEYANEKTFYLRNDVWVDNSFDADADAVEIRYGSDAYFQLLDEADDIGQYLAKGTNVDFCLRGTCFSIREEGGAEAVEDVTPERIDIPDPDPEDTLPASIGPPTTETPDGHESLLLLAGFLVVVLALVAASKKKG